MTFHDKISPHAFPCFSMTVGTLHVRYCDSCLEAGGIARSTAEKWKELLETHTSEDRSDMGWETNRRVEQHIQREIW